MSVENAPLGRSLDVKVVLLLLPLLVALPLLAYAAFLLHLTARQAGEHARREQAAAQDVLQAALRRELEETKQLLAMLAGSPAFAEAAVDPTLGASLAERTVKGGFGIRALAVLSRGGAVALEYPQRAEGPRTVTLAPHQGRIFETGEAVVSDLYQAPLAGQPSVSIDVPVIRGGRVLWIVTALLDPAQLSRTLSEQVGRRDALATVLDSRRRIVARTRDLPQWFGESPSRDTLEAVDSSDRGWRRFQTRDGNEFLWTWSTLPTGWTVWLGSPAREFDDALRASMLRLAAAGVGVLLLALAATALLARRIAASANRMAANARRLTGGERPPYRPSGIRQLDTLYQALEEASENVSRALEAERAARGVADEHNRSKDLFLGMLSHELRNPLAPIRNSVFLLKRAPAGSDPARRAQDVIDRQTEHLTRLVDDLLDVTRIGRGKIELRRSRVDLRDVVAHAAADYRPTLRERGVRFEVQLPGEPLWASADPTRITQLIGNLLHNAAKFTRGGDEVTLALRGAGGEAELRVSDTGVGVEPALLPKLFDPFVQGERTLARTQGGLGLGLALVKGLAELHGGSARAESAGTGRGAEFIVRLPLAEGVATDAELRRAPAAASRNRRRRVLVVEDNRDAAESLADVVETLGHAAEVAYDGPTAIEKARANPPDVVLCDIGLPGMTGYEIAKVLRATSGRAPQLFAVSGYAQPDDVKKALDAGFDGHLAKPLNMDAIERLLA